MENWPLPRLSVEETLDRAVRLAGGCRVEELVGKNPDFDNADYYFENELVIAELKTIEFKAESEEAARASITKMYERWVAEGRVPRPTTSKFKSRSQICLKT